MSSTPRHVRLALALLLWCAPCAFAQKRARAPQPPQSKVTREAERSRRKAVAVLLEVAGQAKALEDPARRAAVLTFTADALWGADEQTARSTFARAWEAATEADEAEFKQEQEGGPYGDLPERFTGTREGVLGAAAQHDPRMADAWLGAITDWLARRRVEEPKDEGGGAGIGPADAFTRDGQRLSLASTLADDGSYAEAARVATPALQSGVNGALVEFLIRLRAGAPEEADRLFLQLLAATRARRDAGGNDVLMLSSYVLTPRLLVAVNADGSVGFRSIGETADASEAPAEAVSAHTREVFFDSAAAILLRASLESKTQGDTSAVYFAIGRLLPFFEQNSPRHLDALQAKLLSLSSQIGLARRDALDPKMETRSLSPRNPTDPLARLLEAAARANDAGARDRARLEVVVAAARRDLWSRARGVADEIVDPEVQRAARAAIESFKVATARTAFKEDEDEFEKTEALARGADVTPALRSYGFALAAELAARRGLRQRTAALLEEAFAQAAQTERATYAREGAALMTATVAMRLDSLRAWDALAAAVAALNEDEKFEGALARFTPEAREEVGPGVAEALEYALGQFDLEELFDAAAQKNFDRAVAEARNLKSQAARSRALITAARAELVKSGNAYGQLRPSR
ncbi:MAG: hypothetical protein JOZ96_25200 [Acidobacteria bacterium]|nr:hypothetical protein [Acidobacteriota bacterium]